MVTLAREDAENLVRGLTYEEFEAARQARIQEEEEAERAKRSEPFGARAVDGGTADREWRALADLKTAGRAVRGQACGTLDRETLLRAVRHNGMALKWAADNLGSRKGRLGDHELISCPGWVLDRQGPDTQCVASFPGVYHEAWAGVTAESLGRSVACAFLQSADDGLGWHCEDLGEEADELRWHQEAKERKQQQEDLAHAAARARACRASQEADMHKKAFVAVRQDDAEALAEILGLFPRDAWSRWRNAAGDDLVTLARQRAGSERTRALLAEALSAEDGGGGPHGPDGASTPPEAGSAPPLPRRWHTAAPPPAPEGRRCYCASLYGERDFRTLGYLQVVGPSASPEERQRTRAIAGATSAYLWDAFEDNALWFELDGRRLVATVVAERRAEEDPLHGMTHCLRYLSAATGREVTEWVRLKPGPPGGLCRMWDRHGNETRYYPYSDHTEVFRPEAERLAKERWLAAGKTAAWGCAWFDRWMRNVLLATERKQMPVVYFYPGQARQGKVAWDALASRATNLWDGTGLGPSQKGEVAWLDKRKIKYLEKDVGDFGTGNLRTGADYCHDREVVMAAVSSHGLALEAASEDLRRDKKVVLQAVRQNGRALRWAAGRLQDDHDVVMAAVAQCGLALEFASDRKRRDQNYWLNEDALKAALR